MKWGFVAKPDLGSYLRDARQLFEHLKKRKQTVQVETLLAKELKVGGTPLKSMEADVYICFGGDGTILLTALHTEKPILAVNAGGIGFLSEVEPKYALVAVDRIIKGDYNVDERRRIACWLNETRVEDAMNEVTVQTERIAKLIKFRIEIDGEVTDTIRGDGVIVATSTGSTGYSLSVGGPIVHPKVDAVIVSPIAPFRLAARPLVVPYASAVKVTLVGRRTHQGQDARLVIDGHAPGYPVGPDDEVTVRPSTRLTRFIRFQGGFYERVRTKLTR